jgi:hypothetical protein
MMILRKRIFLKEESAYGKKTHVKNLCLSVVKTPKFKIRKTVILPTVPDA